MLWDAVFSRAASRTTVQQARAGPPHARVHGLREHDPDDLLGMALGQVVDTIDAITDQGEGSTLPPAPVVTPSEETIPTDDPGAAVRLPHLHRHRRARRARAERGGVLGDNDGADHYERFQQLSTYVDEVVTWPVWLEQHGPWTAADLQAPDYQPTSKYNIPTTAQVAEALNAVAADGGARELSAPQPGVDRGARGCHHGARQVLERLRPGDGRGAVPVPVDGRLRRPDGDLLGLFGKAPDLSLGSRSAPARGAVPLLPGAGLHRLRTERRHQPVRAGHRVPRLQGLERLPGAGWLRLRATGGRRAGTAVQR